MNPRKRVPVLERAFGRLRYEHGCWEFTGAKTNGYGVVGAGGGTRTALVHRIVYMGLVGPIQEGLFLDHLCRNRACCNPLHLEVVTVTENNRRGAKPGVRPGSKWSQARRDAEAKRRSR